MITVFVDPSIAPLEKQQVLLMKACADIGVKCEFVPQRIERTVSFLPPLTESVNTVFSLLVFSKADKCCIKIRIFQLMDHYIFFIL